MATMEQPWPFCMSPARPPGFTVSTSPDSICAFPARVSALSPPHLQLSNRESEALVRLQRSTQSDEAVSVSLSQVPLVVPSEIGRMFSEESACLDGWVAPETCLSGLNLRNFHGNTGSGGYANQQVIEAGSAFYKDPTEADNAEGKHRSSSDGLLDCNLEITKSSVDCDRRGRNMEDILFGLEKIEISFSMAEILLLVRQCRGSRNSLFAYRLHLYICMNGLEFDEVVGNHLVPMLVECGDLQAASRVFSKLVYRNEHSWSFFVLGYAANGNLHHALDLYHEMEENNVQPTIFTFVSLLKACSLAEDLQVGLHLHEQLKQRGLATDIVIGNNLIDMYIKCGSLYEAQKVLEGLPLRDVISWTALLAGYVESDLGKEALALYHNLQLEGISANSVTVALAVKACKLLRAVNEGQIIYTEVVQRGYEVDLIVCNSLVDLYSKCGHFDDAHEVFDNLHSRDVVSWNSLITSYIEHGHFREALNCLVQMQVEKVVPDSSTLSCCLKAFSNLGAVDEGQEAHIAALHLGLAEDLSVTNSLIGFYSSCGLLCEARSVFDKQSEHDVVSWTALISGYAEHGRGKEALACFLEMQKVGISPNAVTFSCSLKACGCIGDDVEGRELHLKVTKWGLDFQSIVANALVSMYAACGLLVEASDVFENISAKCVVSWTALIGAYTDWGAEAAAFELFEQMQAEGVHPNSVTYACILKACGSIGAVEKGRELHVQIAWDGFEMDSRVGSALIHMYATCGSLSEACNVFDDISPLNVSVWSAMMKAYAMNHEGYKAVQCFKDMQQQHCKPDVVAFTCLLTACSHAGLVEEGFQYFKLMRESYNLVPTREHYCCMVDLLARSGDLFEAEKFLETFAPLEETWAALLSSCKTHGEIHLGFRCFHQLVPIDPDNASSYVLMVDICTGSGQSKDAMKIESLRKHMEAKKKPASAWIQIENELHEFTIGNDQNDDVLAAVRNLNLRLKEDGHVPNLNEDVRPTADYEKEVALCQHAEKLAIAFGLLNTPQGTTLRISKNLRMCSDCHNASKSVSKIEKREIILRDDCCMHHFKDGLCVCGDMF